MKKVVIIGGGASGLFASIYIKKYCPENEVIVVERLERMGKKILATGNGRCNFSNTHVNTKKYNNRFSKKRKICNHVSTPNGNN